MTKLHLANTNFEWEIAENKIHPVERGLEKHQIFLQLQFLPFLYADPKDGVAVTNEPDDNFWKTLELEGIQPPQLHLLSSKKVPYDQVETWGASRSTAEWAKQHQISYEIPSWDIITKVNSKEFSFTNSPKLPGS